MKKSLSFKKALIFALNECANKFLTILLISIGWFLFATGCSYTISLVFPGGSSLFGVPQVPVNLSTASHHALYTLITLILFGILEFLYVRLAFMSYHHDRVAPYNLFTGIQFVLIQILRRIAVIIGTLMFILPGIYLSIRYYFPGYTLIDQTTNTMTADVRRNFHITNNIEPDLLNLAMSFNFVLLVPYYLFSMGILRIPFIEVRLNAPLFTALTLPLASFFYVHAYEQLKEQTYTYQ